MDRPRRGSGLRSLNILASSALAAALSCGLNTAATATAATGPAKVTTAGTAAATASRPTLTFADSGTQASLGAAYAKALTNLLDVNTVPGMVQWSPDTPSRPAGGNYGYGDSTITGFSLTHLSGPGCNATGDIPIMPTVGAVDANATSSFSHSNESAAAGSYAVTLGNGVKTELTATTRSGMARFTFPTTSQGNLLFKLGAAATSTTVLNFGTVGSNEVAGAITSGHFCAASPTYTIYFDMVFDRSFSSSGTFANSTNAQHWTLPS
jgi:putative alpha-1,2-mannosidase